MSDLHSVAVTIRRPSRGDPGQAAIGYYRIEGDTLVMTGENGKPIVDRNGLRYERQLGPGADANAIAALLTRQIRSRLVGQDIGFNRPLRYPRASVA